MTLMWSSGMWNTQKNYGRHLYYRFRNVFHRFLSTPRYTLSIRPLRCANLTRICTTYDCGDMFNGTRPQKNGFSLVGFQIRNYFFLCRTRRWYVSVVLQIYVFFSQHTEWKATTLYRDFLFFPITAVHHKFDSLNKYSRFRFRLEHIRARTHPTNFKKLFSFHRWMWCLSRSIQEKKLNEMKIEGRC